MRTSPPDGNFHSLDQSMRYLTNHFSIGSPVVQPIRARSGNLVEEVVALDGSRCCVTATRKSPGLTHDHLYKDTLSEQAFRSIGNALAIFHKNSQKIGYADWDFPELLDADNCFNVWHYDERIDKRIIGKYEKQRESYAEHLPSQEDYGVIHGDIHFDNIIVDTTSNAVTFCDFDDICRGLYVTDLAMILFDLAIIMRCENKAGVVRNLAEIVVNSYSDSRKVDRISLSEMEGFLKLLELSLFIQYYGLYKNSDPLDGWLKLFYEGREERILCDTPLLSDI